MHTKSYKHPTRPKPCEEERLVELVYAICTLGLKFKKELLYNVNTCTGDRQHHKFAVKRPLLPVCQLHVKSIENNRQFDVFTSLSAKVRPHQWRILHTPGRDTPFSFSSQANLSRIFSKFLSINSEIPHRLIPEPTRGSPSLLSFILSSSETSIKCQHQMPKKFQQAVTFSNVARSPLRGDARTSLSSLFRRLSKAHNFQAFPHAAPARRPFIFPEGHLHVRLFVLRIFSRDQLHRLVDRYSSLSCWPKSQPPCLQPSR